MTFLSASSCIDICAYIKMPDKFKRCFTCNTDHCIVHTKNTMQPLNQDQVNLRAHCISYHYQISLKWCYCCQILSIPWSKLLIIVISLCQMLSTDMIIPLTLTQNVMIYGTQTSSKETCSLCMTHCTVPCLYTNKDLMQLLRKNRQIGFLSVFFYFIYIFRTV